MKEQQKEAIRERIKGLSQQKEPISTGLEPISLQSSEQLKAVYVDVYGTILISGTEPMMRRDEDRNERLLKQTFTEFGCPADTKTVRRAVKALGEVVQESHKEQKSRGIDHPEVDIVAIWEKLLVRVFGDAEACGLRKEQIPELLTDFVTRYDEPWLMPGLTGLMTFLKRKKIRTGIISNSQFYTPLTLEALSGHRMEDLGFDERDCFWSYKEKIAKPSVHFYKRAVKHLKSTYNLEAGEVLFVGNDMLNDVYPASRAGFVTALFAGDQRSLRLREDDERCSTLQPDMVVTHLSQIEALFT